MRSNNVSSQKGFAHVVLLVVLVAVAVVAFAGYRVYSSRQATTTESAQTSSSKSTNLTTINKELDQADAQLDSGLNDTQLDADIDSL